MGTIVKPPLPVLNRRHPLAKGIVACYPFSDKCGTTLRDISGKNNHGTLISMDPATDWVKTPYGYGLDFDGVDDHILVPHTPSLEFAQFTIEAWIKTSNTNTGIIVRKYLNVAPYYGYALHNAPNQLNMWVGGNAWTTASFTWDNNWHHTVGSYDGVTVRIYVDSVLLASQAQTHNQSNAPLYIGSSYGTSELLDGTIVSTCIYNCALQSPEIKQLHADPWEMYRLDASYKRYLGKISGELPESYMRAMKYW